MADLFYPSAQRLEKIDQDLLAVKTMDDPAFTDLFPIEDVRDYVLRWEQKDNYKGLQAIRGLNGTPPNVQRVGGKSWEYKPAVFGEEWTIDEHEMTRRREWGSLETPIDITDLIAEGQEQLINREINRMKYVAWTAATTGTITVQDKDGTTMYSDTFPMQTFTAQPGWGTLATATPLQDLRNIKLLARGHSVDFGSRATLYMNQTDVNHLLGNQNSNDLYGRRGMYGATLNGLRSMNDIFLENGLPLIEVYDGGYIDNTGTFQLFIPPGAAILVGKRPNGEPVGRYRRTFNAVNRSPGSYLQIIENPVVVPPKVTISRGHNGGVVVFYPSALVRMTI